LKAFEPNFLPISLGSVPHQDPETACGLVLKDFPQIPSWPQLPKRSFLENMYVQYSESFPGVVLEDGRIYVDRSQDLTPGLETLYMAYLEDDLDHAAISTDYAAGLPVFLHALDSTGNQRVAVKGQVTGPISWGLVVVDQNRRPILYDEILADAAARHLRLKAAWQERELRQLCPTVITCVDEPYMASFGSAFVSLGREQAITLLEEVLAGIQGIKGVHCCGNTDWSILLSTSIDFLSLDAYEYAEALSLYPDEVKAFLERGGIIAWGIVPTSDQVYHETAESLVEKLHWAMNLLVKKGIPLDRLLESALISASCGVGPSSEPTAERALSLAAEVSDRMREKYL
jgi:hypothetical protein